jgi:acyl carrier protein
MNTLETLQGILADEFKLSPAQLQPEVRLEDLGVDSLNLIELIFKLEDRFNLKINDDGRRLITIKDVVGYVDELLAKQAETPPEQVPSG